MRSNESTKTPREQKLPLAENIGVVAHEHRTTSGGLILHWDQLTLSDDGRVTHVWVSCPRCHNEMWYRYNTLRQRQWASSCLVCSQVPKEDELMESGVKVFNSVLLWHDDKLFRKVACSCGREQWARSNAISNIRKTGWRCAGCLEDDRAARRAEKAAIVKPKRGPVPRKWVDFEKDGFSFAKRDGLIVRTCPSGHQASIRRVVYKCAKCAAQSKPYRLYDDLEPMPVGGGYMRVRIPGDHWLYPVASKSRGTAYMLHHRFVMSCHLSRPLDRHEVVHHLNGVRDDNRIENLELLTTTTHHPGHGDHYYQEWQRAEAELRRLQAA